MFFLAVKLKNAKITFTDESRYNLIKPITTGQEKVDSTLAQFVQILNGIQTSLGKDLHIYNNMRPMDRQLNNVHGLGTFN